MQGIYGEMQGRNRGDAGKIWGCAGEIIGEMQGRYRATIVLPVPALPRKVMCIVRWSFTWGDIGEI